MNSSRLDHIDFLLLKTLQAQGRTRSSELAELAGLSLPAVSDRMKKLKEQGYIAEFRAVLDARKMGFDVTAFIIIGMESSKHYPAFLKQVEQTPQILECHAITGEGSHLLKVRTVNNEALEMLLAKIQSWPGVKQTLTRVALSSPKETTSIPLGDASSPI